MKNQFKPCKVCSKMMPKGLNSVCSAKCQKEKEKIKKRTRAIQKKMSVSSLAKVADGLWSKVVRKAWKCSYCWKRENLNAHHIFSRNNKSVRWELSNWISLCSWCHTFNPFFSAHKTPCEFTYWLENYRSKAHLMKLQELAHIPLKVTPEYLLEKIRSLKLNLDDEM